MCRRFCFILFHEFTRCNIKQGIFYLLSETRVIVTKVRRLLKLSLNCAKVLWIFLCQRLNTATSSPADDVHHYAVPRKLLDSIFNKLPVFIHQWEKEGCCLSGRSSAPIAGSVHVATMVRKHRVLNLREINRNNTHTDLASVLTYYG
jgi:hypothetical protein